MKVIDSYQTPDGRYEYRVEVDGEPLPPMSFEEKKTNEEIETIITGLINSLKEGETATQDNIITIPYKDEDELSSITQTLNDANISYTVSKQELAAENDTELKEVV